eukprot:GSChrysophyteH1.ASY1.ANO1.1727.1 assembled CDS
MPGLREREASPERSAKRAKLGLSYEWSTVMRSVTEVMDSSEGLRALVKNTFIDAEVVADDDDSHRKLENLLSAVQKGYMYTPYHNFAHACHVFMNTFVLLQDSVIAFTRVERAALLFGAIVHDLEHQGVPNAQLVKEGSPLALKYSNSSVAENNSIDVALELLERPDKDIFGFSPPESQRFSSLLRAIILATDIADRERIAGLYSDLDKAIFIPEPGWTEDPQTATPDVDSHRQLLLCLFMKAADVGAPFQEASCSDAWAQRFYNECRNAHKTGRADAIVNDRFVPGQIGFYDSYLKHLNEVLASTGAVSTRLTDAMTTNLKNLRQSWVEDGTRIVEKFQAAYVQMGDGVEGAA